MKIQESHKPTNNLLKRKYLWLIYGSSIEFPEDTSRLHTLANGYECELGFLKFLGVSYSSSVATEILTIPLG